MFNSLSVCHMNVFDLELRVSKFGSILTWKVYLEDSTDPNREVREWDSCQDGSRDKCILLPNYAIEDSTLEVFAMCNGISGGHITCTVTINGEKKEESIVARVVDKAYARGSYPVSTIS
jgi:hypothetical protein